MRRQGILLGFCVFALLFAGIMSRRTDVGQKDSSIAVMSAVANGDLDRFFNDNPEMAQPSPVYEEPTEKEKRQSSILANKKRAIEAKKEQYRGEVTLPNIPESIRDYDQVTFIPVTRFWETSFPAIKAARLHLFLMEIAGEPNPQVVIAVKTSFGWQNLGTAKGGSNKIVFSPQVISTVRLTPKNGVTLHELHLFKKA